MSRRRFVPIDVQMLLDTEETRSDHDAALMINGMNYKNMGLIVTSSRKCDDGAIIGSTLWLPGMTGIDTPFIQAAFEGFEEPQWPAPAYNPEH